MPRVELSELRKRFGAVQALDGAGLELEAGEVHALLGQNGAGKTTLVRVLYGVVRPDSGSVRIDGEPVLVRGPRHALELGIGLVHQHFMLVPELTVAENLALGERGGPLLGPRALRAQALPVLERYDLGFEPDRRVGELSVAQRQRLEIARALSRGVRVLVLDEPTAVLAPSEIDALLELLARLREDGCSVLFISHKLDEITAVCDRVTVLREGRRVATRAVAGLDHRELGELMVGRAPPPPGQPPRTQTGGPVLRGRGLRAAGLSDLDIDVNSGEIFAIAGIDGNGQEALEEVLAGVRPLDAGEMEVMAAPRALLSGDRHRTGLVLGLPVDENLVLEDVAHGGDRPEFRWGFASPRELRAGASGAIERFGIRAAPEDPVGNLSGGNQQKVCVARALRRDPDLLVAVNPTRGLDLGATAQVREALREEARRGAGVLVISTDLDEVFELATRMSVLFRGRLLPVEPEQRTRERVGELMLGRGAT